MRVLPPNERNQVRVREGTASRGVAQVFLAQFRWNSNPFDMDGGDGMSEFDAGAWLTPYWMSVFWGIIAE